MTERVVMTLRKGDWHGVRHAIECYQDKHFATTDRPLEVTIGENEPRRTDAQNRYFWPMCQQIADSLNSVQQDGTIFNKQDIHDRLVAERYGYVEKAIAGMVVPQLPKTSRMDKAQMTDLIEWSLKWAADLGFTVMMPADYSDWARQ